MTESVQNTTTKWGTELRLYTRDDTIDKGLLHHNIVADEYHLEALGKPDTVMLDIGAHTGLVAIAAASLGMQVVAVECLPDNVILMRKNVALNRYNDIISIVDKAIHSDSKGQILVYHDLDIPENRASGKKQRFMSGTTRRFHDDASTKGHQRVWVGKVTLDELVTGPVQILKTDCEGAEGSMIEGATDETLDQIKYVVGEFHPRQSGCLNWHTFFAMFRGKFKDVSSKYGDDSTSGRAFSHFVLEHV